MYNNEYNRYPISCIAPACLLSHSCKDSDDLYVYPDGPFIVEITQKHN